MKHKFLQLVLLANIIYANAFAQPVIVGQKAIGGEYDDFLSRMYLTKDGGLIVGGYSSSNKSGQKTENSRGGIDYWVVKLDNSYKIEWDKTIGGSSDDYLWSLQQTDDGGYILGGYSYSNKSSEKTENSRGGVDYWVVKLDNSGNTQWDKTIGGSDNDWLFSLQQTVDGGYILGGYSYSNKSGEKTENSRGGVDYWVVKLDRSGNIQWDKTIGGTSDDALVSLQQTTDEGYILGGRSSSNISGEKTENGRGSGDYWVVKLNDIGNIQWDKTFGGDDWDALNSLQQTSDGGYILGGFSESDISGEKTEKGRGSLDYWVVKLNKYGKVQWDKTVGGSGQDELSSLQQTIDSGYILGGSSASNISGEKTEKNRGGYFDYWVVKLNKSGKVQWDKTIGGDREDECFSAKEIAKNHYIIGGWSNSHISGDKTAHIRGPYGAADYWRVMLVYKRPGTFEITESQNENVVTSKIKSSTFTIYPNPAKDILHVQINGKAVVSLTDQSGKVLLTTTISGSGIINVSGLKPGLYYLKNSTTGAVQKVIVSR